MKIIVCENYNEMSQKAADIFASQLILKPNSILGLATGSTPIGMYDKLAELNKSGKIDFAPVKSFNLDEYYPIDEKNDQSYRYFMNEHLFSKVNIDIKNTRVPDGNAKDVEKMCKNYDAAIDAAGGIDLQVLGIGQNGHIAFNEPDEALVAGTHVTSLTENTVNANSRFFASVDEVPKHAVTMGMASILKARKIVILANGKNKHEAVMSLLDDKITTKSPATLLKVHPDVVLICDKEAYNG